MQRLLNNNNNGELEEPAEQKRGIFSMLGASFNSTAEEIERLKDATSKLNIVSLNQKLLENCFSLPILFKLFSQKLPELNEILFFSRARRIANHRGLEETPLVIWSDQELQGKREKICRNIIWTICFAFWLSLGTREIFQRIED